MTRLISILLVVCFICVGVANATPTRFPNGVVNVGRDNLMGDSKTIDPTVTHVYWEDWDYYTAGDWTVTSVEGGSGDATEALEDADGGRLRITPDDAEDDYTLLEKVGESFLFEAGKPTWFKALLRTESHINSDIIIGLTVSGITSPVISNPGLTDGVFFSKPGGSSLIDFTIRKDSVDTDVQNIATAASATDIVLGFYYDGKSVVEYWVDDVHIGTASTTNLPDDEVLTVVFGTQNYIAAARYMSVEYIMAIKNR